MSTETKFTKGEWKALSSRNHYEIYAINGNFSTPVCDLVYHPSSEFNAHLIAAAPKMYEMLETAMNILTGDDFKNEVSAIDIEQLLAQARGE